MGKWLNYSSTFTSRHELLNAYFIFKYNEIAEVKILSSPKGRSESQEQTNMHSILHSSGPAITSIVPVLWYGTARPL